jgi:hypothetical protein
VSELGHQAQRAILGLALVALVACTANFYLELHTFGQYDEAALVVSIIIVAVLAHLLRPRLPKRTPTFSWRLFALIAAAVPGIAIGTGWQKYFRPEAWSLKSLAMFVLPATLVIFLGRRWRLLRKELSEGTFSLERYYAKPGTYLMGPFRQQLLWLIGAITLILALTIAQVLLGG